jgi:hypothetical protein
VLRALAVGLALLAGAAVFRLAGEEVELKRGHLGVSWSADAHCR